MRNTLIKSSETGRKFTGLSDLISSLICEICVMTLPLVTGHFFFVQQKMFNENIRKPHQTTTTTTKENVLSKRSRQVILTNDKSDIIK